MATTNPPAHTAVLPPAPGSSHPQTSTMRRWIHKCLHAIFPCSCVICHAELDEDSVPFFCAACWAGLTPFAGPQCPRCSRPFESALTLTHSPAHRCSECRVHPPAYTRAWALYPYRSPLKEAIGLLKYRGKVSLATPLGNLMIDARQFLPPIDFIIPVPLSPHRLRFREFNQSALFAHHVSRQWNISLLLSALERRKETVPQTTLNRRARVKNLRKAFAVSRPAAIKGKSLLLIDDVWTTGTTINECAKALRKAGSHHVYALTLARQC